MQLTCENCQRRYSVPDEKLRGRSVKVRCPTCQHIALVKLADVPAAAPAPAPAAPPRAAAALSPPPPPAAASREQARWFAMVKGAQQGPFDAAQVLAKVRAGELHSRSYLWKHGMSDWKRFEELSELQGLLASPPAAPPPPPPAPAARLSAAPAPLPVVPRSTASRPALSPAPAPHPEPAPKLEVPAPQPASAAAPAPAASAPRLSDTLFSDEELPRPEERALDLAPSPEQKPVAEQIDPFSALGEIDPDKLPPAGEATQFFMKQAGVNKGQRNPPWKIALFVLLFVGVPVGALYLLSELKVVPLEVTRVNAQGEQVSASVFSAEGVSGLGELLLGKNKKAPITPQEPQKVVASRERKPPPPRKQQEPGKAPAPDQPSADDLAALYGDTRLQSQGPKLKLAAEKPVLDSSKGDLDQEQVMRVVAQAQPAFQSCIEVELKKNPNLRVGKIIVSATVAGSGVVTRAELDKREVSLSPLGECLKSRALRMRFGATGGEETELQIPLMVTSSF